MLTGCTSAAAPSDFAAEEPDGDAADERLLRLQIAVTLGKRPDGRR